MSAGSRTFHVGIDCTLLLPGGCNGDTCAKGKGRSDRSDCAQEEGNKGFMLEECHTAAHSPESPPAARSCQLLRTQPSACEPPTGWCAARSLTKPRSLHAATHSAHTNLWYLSRGTWSWAESSPWVLRCPWWCPARLCLWTGGRRSGQGENRPSSRFTFKQLSEGKWGAGAATRESATVTW